MQYEFTGEVKEFDGISLRRIRRLFDGALGGWIEKEANLSHDGNAWVFRNAWVSGNARVSGDALVYGNAWVSGNARVSGDALVYGNAWVSGDARVQGDNDLFLVGPIGSRHAFLTVTLDAKIKVRFTTGCFSGDKKSFKEAVKKTHGSTSQFAKQYAAAIKMTEICVKARKS